MKGLSRIVKLANPAAALPAPKGKVVKVRTTRQLFAAVAAARAGTTVMLAPGTYDVHDLMIATDRITLRGAGGDREKVVLDGGGRFGRMIVVRGAKDLTVADLTMRNCKQYGIFMLGDSGVRRMNVYNVKFRNIWTRAVKGTHPARVDDSPTRLNSPARVRRVRPVGGSIRHCLFVNDRVKPYPDGFNGDYVSAIDMMWLKDWVIADNAFVGIRGRNGHARGAIFVWVHSENVVAERNVFFNCDRAIAFGNPTGERPHMIDGIIRNNFIVGGVYRALELESTRGLKVYNNSIWATQRVFPAVSFDHGSAGAKFHNNLVHGWIFSFGAIAKSHNVMGDLSGYFACPAEGDLHLTGGAVEALGRGKRLPEVTDDFDGRPRSKRPDIGAHESGLGEE